MAEWQQHCYPAGASDQVNRISDDIHCSERDSSEIELAHKKRLKKVECHIRNCMHTCIHRLYVQKCHTERGGSRKRKGWWSGFG